MIRAWWQFLAVVISVTALAACKCPHGPTGPGPVAPNPAAHRGTQVHVGTFSIHNPNTNTPATGWLSAVANVERWALSKNPAWVAPGPAADPAYLACDYRSTPISDVYDFLAWVRSEELFAETEEAAVDMCTHVVTEKAAPTLTNHPMDKTVAAGQIAEFSAAYVESGTIKYQWQKKTGNQYGDLSNGGAFAGVDAPTLRVTASSGLNNTYYRCVVMHSTTAGVVAATATKSAKLTVQ